MKEFLFSLESFRWSSCQVPDTVRVATSCPALFHTIAASQCVVEVSALARYLVSSYVPL